MPISGTPPSVDVAVRYEKEKYRSKECTSLCVAVLAPSRIDNALDLPEDPKGGVRGRLLGIDVGGLGVVRDGVLDEGVELGEAGSEERLDVALLKFQGR